MNKNEVQSLFSKYSKHFQEKLCFLILEDRSFSDRMIEVLNIEHLELKYLQLFVGKIFEFKLKYKTHPSQEVIENILRVGLEGEPEVLQKQVRDYYFRLKTTRFETEEKYIQDEALDFCRRQKLQEAMLQAVKLIKTSNFDQVSKLINNALKLGSDNNVGYDYLVDFEKRYVENVRFPVATGWDLIDGITAGGLGRGEYGLLIACSGAGKSHALVNLASNALREGKTVVFYTLELKAEVIALRTDANITGIAKDDLINNKEEVLKLIKSLPGRLVIKHYPKKAATLQTIRGHIEKLIDNGCKPDLVLIDYLELLKPSTMRNESRHETEDQFAEFESMCQEFDFAGWTASQTNRKGFNAEIVTLEEVSEFINKCFGAYLIITLSRDTYDKANNTGKFFIAKNRNGQDGLIYDIFMDTARSEIRVLSQRSEEDDEEREKHKTNIQNKIYEKFKRIKDQGKN